MLRELTVESRGRGAYDITPLVEEVVRESGLRKGVIFLFTTDPLCRLITIEYDANLVEDLMSLISGLKVRNPYVIASIFQSSATIPFEGGLQLGAFQQVCLLDLNESTGARKVLAEVVA